MEVNAQTRRFINEQVRPLAEKAITIYALGISVNAALGTYLAEFLASGALTIDEQTGVISASEPSTVIDDGRAAEGVTQITTGDLAAILNMHRSVTAQIAAEPGIQSAMERASVRKRIQG